MNKTFRELGVAEPLCSALSDQGIETAFPIQQMTLPLALQGHDLIGQARTGTGKTFAFGLPLLQRLKPGVNATQALIIVPTRELCLQVFNDLSIGAALGLRSIAVYGGVGYDEQTEALGGGAHVVVGTPGRLLDLLQRHVLDLSQVTQLVLDEADEMLDMGFLPDVERLIEACATDGRQTMLFSATMPTAIVKLGRRYMQQPTFIRAEHEEVGTAPTVEQFFFQVHRMDKPRVLARILQDASRQAVYVFVRTKHMADRLVTELEDLGTPAIAIHGDLRQTTRERNLDRFRAGKASVLVATEVAARGLDVDNVTHVVNYDCPDDDKMYLHRIGRTARAGRDGVAVTFAEHHETERLNVIRKAVGAGRDVTPVFSTSPELAEWFDLPAETPWQHLGRSGQPRGKNADATTNAKPRGKGASRGKDSAGDNNTSNDKSADRGKAASRARSASSNRAPAAKVSAASDQSASDNAGARRQDDASADSPAAGRTRTRTRDRGTATQKDQPSSRRRNSSTDQAAPNNDHLATEENAPTTSPKRPSNGAARATNSNGARRRSRPRDRAEHQDAATSGKDRSLDAPRASADGAQPSGSATTSSTSNGGAGSRRSSRSSGSSRSTTSGSSRSGPSGSASNDRRSSNGRGGGRTDGRNDGRGDERNDGRGDTRTPARATQPAGADARGEGQPQLERAVRIEHLP